MIQQLSEGQQLSDRGLKTLAHRTSAEKIMSVSSCFPKSLKKDQAAALDQYAPKTVSFN